MKQAHPDLMMLCCVHTLKQAVCCWAMLLTTGSVALFTS